MEKSWLFENHFEFLATHRGSVTRLEDAFTVESDRAEFTYAVLGRGGDRGLLDRFKTVHLFDELNDVRFKQRAGLTYMTHDGDVKAWPTNARLEIVRVTTEKEMDAFSHVQAAGFAQKQDDYDRWHPWLRSANHRNLRNGQQSFYVGFLDGKPVGATLLVMTKGLAGIYAVATLADHRKQGVGSSLMAQAVADGRKRGGELVTLQVAEGSYAESLYERLGFKARFKAKIFARE